MIKNRKFNFINKKTMAGLLCGIMCLSVPQAAFAATPAPTQNAGVTVNIGADPLLINITVPSTATFAFNADGSNTIPTNFDITTHTKIASFYLKDLSLDAGVSGWQVVNTGAGVALDEKTLKLKIGEKSKEKQVVPNDGEKNAIGMIHFANTDFVLKPEIATTLSFLVDRPIYTEKIEEAKAFDMSLDFEMK